MFYSYKNQYPISFDEVPDRIRLSDGSTRTDKTTFTPEELLDAGYVMVNDKPTVDKFQKLIWDGSNWVIEDYTETEKNAAKVNQWDIIRAERNRLLAETDWIVIKYLENNDPLLGQLSLYRQKLRDITQTQIDPYNIVWPTNERNSDSDAQESGPNT